MGAYYEILPKDIIGTTIYADGEDGSSSLVIPTHGKMRSATMYNDAFFRFSEQLGYTPERVVNGVLWKHMSELRFTSLHDKKRPIAFPSELQPYSEDAIRFQPPLTDHAITALHAFISAELEIAEEGSYAFIDARGAGLDSLPSPRELDIERTITKD